jgi:hypothetical protein
MRKSNKATHRPRKRRLERRTRQDFLVRDIDPKLWAAVKRRANRDGRTLRRVVLDLLTIYANHDLITSF